MAEYLIATLFAFLLGKAASIVRKTPLRLILLIAACVPFCYLAGMRAITVGIDTSVYPRRAFIISSVSSLGSTLAQYSSNVEPVYLTTVWVVTKMTSDFNMVLLVSQVLVIAPLMYALNRACPSRIGEGLILYGIVLFPYTLNVMRQAIAFSMLLIALYAAIDRRPIKFILVVLLAMGFHLSGILGLLLWPLVAVSNEGTRVGHTLRQNESLRFLMGCGLALFVIITIAFGDEFTRLLPSIKTTYQYQADHAGTGDTNITYLVFTVAMAMYCGSILSRKTVRGIKKTEIIALMSVVIAAGMLSLLSIITNSLFRLGFLLSIFACPLFALLLDNDDDGGSGVIVEIAMILLFLFFFYWFYVHGSAGGVIPYEFAT